MLRLASVSIILALSSAQDNGQGSIKGACKPVCKLGFKCQKGKCVAAPKSPPVLLPGDCTMQEGITLHNGERYQNPATCATLFCYNGTVGMLDCPVTRCANGDEKACDPDNGCAPKPCAAIQNLDCLAGGGFPLIKDGESFRDPLTCKTRSCNNGFLSDLECSSLLCADSTIKLCDPKNDCQPVPCGLLPAPVVPAVPAVPLACQMLNGFPPLAHGATWRDPVSCTTYKCDNGIRIETPCAINICGDGTTRTCDPANSCTPRDCGPDCPATGEFPFMVNSQKYVDAKSCNTYSCLNRVSIRESCPVAICSNGEIRPCDPTNRCLPLACTSGSIILPSLTDLIGSALWTNWPALPLPTWGALDCLAFGSVPFLKHGSSWTDMSTCTIHTCNNGMTSASASCVSTLCNGRLLACDPTNFCLPRPCFLG